MFTKLCWFKQQQYKIYSRRYGPNFNQVPQPSVLLCDQTEMGMVETIRLQERIRYNFAKVYHSNAISIVKIWFRPRCEWSHQELQKLDKIGNNANIRDFTT